MQFIDHVVDLANAAIGLVDMRQHVATHPRLGAVDHISCHPVPEGARMHAARRAAQSIVIGLAARQPQLAILKYGEASDPPRRLQDIRRECGAPKLAALGLRS